MCQMGKREGTVSFAVIRRDLRELVAKNHVEPSDPPPLQVRGLSTSEYEYFSAKIQHKWHYFTDV